MERKLKQRLEEAGHNTMQVQKEAVEREEQKEEMLRAIKNQEFELEKLKRLVANKEEEVESERKRFT